MAGHSKWANIRRHKEKQDAKKGKAYTKLIRAVTVAARTSSNPDDNPSLRQAIDKALAANMNNDIIERAIKRASSNDPDLAGVNAVRYEAYGPDGVALIIECLTNNRNRTVGEIRHILSKHGGKLGTDGSVSYLFNQVGIIQVEINNAAALEQVINIASDFNAQDFVVDEQEMVELVVDPPALSAINNSLLANQLIPSDSYTTLRADNVIIIDDHDSQVKILELIEQLEDLDDVQTVYTNTNISD